MIDLGDFKGAAKRLDGVDIPVMADRINVPEDRVHALDETESRGEGFDKSGRPKMLFEPHLFYANLDGAEREEAVKAELAYPKWRKGYPVDSYPRLVRAMAINRDAALKSASWGRYQTLGEHHRILGYRTVDAMVDAFMDDEEAHLEAFVAFIIVNKVDDDLREGRYDVFFRAYNGPAYKENGYPAAYARNLKKWQGIADTPVEHSDQMVTDASTLKVVQQRLRDLGYPEVGMVDGLWGTRVRGAILTFRADRDLPLIPVIDQQLLAELMQAAPRPVSEARATATAAELKAKGSSTIQAADASRGAAVAMTSGGVALGLMQLLPQIDGASKTLVTILDRLRPYMDTIYDLMPWAAAGLGAYIAAKQLGIIKARVNAYRTGENVSEGTHAPR